MLLAALSSRVKEKNEGAAGEKILQETIITTEKAKISQGAWLGSWVIPERARYTNVPAAHEIRAIMTPQPNL